MGSLAWRLILVLVCTAWLGAWDYYSNIDEEPPGGRDFWMGSTTGNVILWAVPFAVAALVARFWVLLAVAGFVIDRISSQFAVSSPTSATTVSRSRIRFCG